MSYEFDIMRSSSGIFFRLEQQRQEVETLRRECEIMRINAFRMQSAAEKTKDCARLAQSLIDRSRLLVG